MARSAGRYDGSLRDIIHAFKYRRPSSARRAARAAHDGRRRRRARRRRRRGSGAAPSVAHASARIQSGRRPRASTWAFPVWRVLRRSRHGPPQATLPAVGGDANVGGAFAFGPVVRTVESVVACPAARPHGRARRRRDDDRRDARCVQRGAARRAGVRNVRALTVARAVATRPAPRPADIVLATAPRR